MDKSKAVTTQDLKNLKADLKRTIADVLASEPQTTQVEIAKRFGCSREWVILIGREFGIRRPRGRKPTTLAVQ